MIKNCYVWTRVSTKYQEENGGSLDDQKCRCEKYAKDNGFKFIVRKEIIHLYHKEVGCAKTYLRLDTPHLL